MFLQEIQDNSGPTDDGVVDANITLSTLVRAIAAMSNVTYQFAYINPVDNQDGGQPGGNIRTTYLYVFFQSQSFMYFYFKRLYRYRAEKLHLVGGSPVGGSLDSVQVVKHPFLGPKLKSVALNYSISYMQFFIPNLASIQAVLIQPMLLGTQHASHWWRIGKPSSGTFSLLMSISVLKEEVRAPKAMQDLR